MNLRALKNSLKDRLRAAGWHLFTDGSLPPGVDWLQDLRRLGLGSSGEPRPLTLCDVGANVGQTAAELHGAFPGATIYSFEPFRATFEALRARAAAMPGVHAVPLALGAQPGTMSVTPGTESVFNSLRPAVEPDTAGGMGAETIRVETLDRFCAERDIAEIDLLKTDTEGYDLEVLHGAETLLGAGRVRFIHTEVAFCADNRQNTPFAPIYELLTAKGFRFLGLYELYPFQHNPEAKAFCNALFERRRSPAAGPAAGRSA